MVYLFYSLLLVKKGRNTTSIPLGMFWYGTKEHGLVVGLGRSGWF